MRAVVVYESMYGNTHQVAAAIGGSLESIADVVIVPVEAAEPKLIESADLLVVGGPTHVHGMSRASTRKAALGAVQKADNDLELDPDAEGIGLREWFEELGRISVPAAAFDTRMHGPPALTGRASKGIARRLEQHGASLVIGPESFVVTKDNHMEPGEMERACGWGATLASTVSAAKTTDA